MKGGGGGGRCGLLRGSETTTGVTVRAVNVHDAMRGWMAEHSYKRMYNSWAFILYRCAVTFTVGLGNSIALSTYPEPYPLTGRPGRRLCASRSGCWQRPGNSQPHGVSCTYMPGYAREQVAAAASSNSCRATQGSSGHAVGLGKISDVYKKVYAGRCPCPSVKSDSLDVDPRQCT